MPREVEKKEMANELYEEMVLSEAEVQANVVKNLNYFMYKYGDEITSQKKMAELLGIGAPQLTKILKGEQTPTVYPFLANIKKWFHYSIDEFLYTDIEMTEKLMGVMDSDLPTANYMKFVGLYQLYYFDTSSFKGRERSDNAKALKSGVMHVEKDPKTDKYTVVAIFNMHKDRADAFYREAASRGQGRSNSYIRQYIVSMGSSQHVYYGELELSTKYVYVSLRFENTKDRVQMIFHRPDGNSNKYIGGLGTMVSVSKGRNSAPCLQYIALADTSLHVSEEELAVHLLMHYPNLKTYDSIDDLVEFASELYSTNSDGSDHFSRLSSEHKKTLIRNRMDQIVNETVEKNLFRTVVVSAVDDDEFYHYIKRVKAYMRSEVR